MQLCNLFACFSGNVSKEEARALCADIFLQQFVCPAIVNPELYGVTGDVPVSDMSRSNLMQIAQVCVALFFLFSQKWALKGQKNLTCVHTEIAYANVTLFIKSRA